MLNWKKSRTVDNPYKVFAAGGWEWRILKAYNKDPYTPNARAFCAVSSPYTFGGYDMGDVYIAEIPGFLDWYREQQVNN